MSELTQVAVLPYRFSNATPGEFLRQSAIANNKLLESEGFDAEPLAFIASKTLKHFGFLSHAAGWSKFSRRAEQSVMTRFAFGLQEPHGSAFVLRPTRNYPFGKRLKIIDLLAERVPAATTPGKPRYGPVTTTQLLVILINWLFTAVRRAPI